MNVQKKLENHYVIECFRKGKLIFKEEFDNLVTTEGLNDSLDKHLRGNAYTAAWFIGLTTGSPVFAAGNTMASHAGWTEAVAYSESVRQTLQLSVPSAGACSNTDNRAVFTINADSTVLGGAFICSNSTKSGTTGILYGGNAFSANRTLNNGDEIRVTITCSASAA